MKTTFTIMTVLVATAIGCGSSDADSTEIDAATAKQKAQAIVGGTPAEPVRIDKEDEHRWAVDVKMPNGAGVTVELERTTGELDEIEGKEAPFDYAIAAPLPGYLSFDQAKEKAFAQKTGNVQVWELDVPKTQYEIYVRTEDEHLFEIKLDAKSGDLRTIKEKDQPD